jgi:hypothetical protein
MFSEFGGISPSLLPREWGKKAERTLPLRPARQGDGDEFEVE